MFETISLGCGSMLAVVVCWLWLLHPLKQYPEKVANVVVALVVLYNLGYMVYALFNI